VSRLSLRESSERLVAALSRWIVFGGTCVEGDDPVSRLLSLDVLCWLQNDETNWLFTLLSRSERRHLRCETAFDPCFAAPVVGRVALATERRNELVVHATFAERKATLDLISPTSPRAPTCECGADRHRVLPPTPTGGSGSIVQNHPAARMRRPDKRDSS